MKLLCDDALRQCFRYMPYSGVVVMRRVSHRHKEFADEARDEAQRDPVRIAAWEKKHGVVTITFPDLNHIPPRSSNKSPRNMTAYIPVNDGSYGGQLKMLIDNLQVDCGHVLHFLEDMHRCETCDIVICQACRLKIPGGDPWCLWCKVRKLAPSHLEICRVSPAGPGFIRSKATKQGKFPQLLLREKTHNHRTIESF